MRQDIETQEDNKVVAHCIIAVPRLAGYSKPEGAQHSGQTVTAACAIGDNDVTFTYEDGHSETQSFSEIVEQSRLYILTVGGFERFAEWGLIRHKDV